jgi:hypothetical protein
MSELTRDQHEMLIDIVIAATYGYHCAVTGKEFSNKEALDEYMGNYNFNSTELRLPILRNIVQSTVGQILELIGSNEDIRSKEKAEAMHLLSKIEQGVNK